MPIRIVTWNMQGGGGTDTAKNNTLYGFMREGFDVICLQEATNKLESFTLDSGGHHNIRVYNQIPSRRASVNYTCYAYIWGNGNSRCSLITYVKNGSVGIHDYGTVNYPVADVRPMLWVRVRFGAEHCYIANVHLPSGTPVFAKSVFNSFKNDITAYLHSYAITGDFNMIPSFIQANFSDYNNFYHPSVPTHQSGSTLDYVYSTEPVHIDGYSAGYTSDHRHLICTLG